MLWIGRGRRSGTGYLDDDHAARIMVADVYRRVLRRAPRVSRRAYGPAGLVGRGRQADPAMVYLQGVWQHP